MASLKAIFVDWLTGLVGGKITSSNILTYENRYEWGDLADDDIVTKYLVRNFIPLPTPIVTAIDGGVTANPITVAHTSMVYPSVLLLDGSGVEYTGATWVDDGTSIILTGDDDGSGHFADSFVFVIKA